METMKVDGTKVVRTDKEVVLKKEEPEVAQGAPGQPPTGQPPAQAQPAATTQDADGPQGRPSLKRPGEDTGADGPVPLPGKPRKAPQPPPTGGPDTTVPKPQGS